MTKIEAANAFWQPRAMLMVRAECNVCSVKKPRRSERVGNVRDGNFGAVNKS